MKMLLTDAQVDSYRDNGFLVLNSVFGTDEVDAIRAAMARDSRSEGPHRIMQPHSGELSTLYASHQRVAEFGNLIRAPRLLTPAQTLLGGDVYLYQLKINVKEAFGGGKVAWHQDFAAWRIVDELPTPDLVNVALLLDEATEFNGPLIFIPGSHTSGTLRADKNDSAAPAPHLDPDDIALRPPHIAELVDERGMISVQAPAGSLVLFSPQIVHGSVPNMSPTPRRLLIATYNRCVNLPRTSHPRPNYLVNDDTTALSAVGDDFLTAPVQQTAGSAR
ncbi:phytanoyl-CoA dioxygenase family protein [Nocardia sp. NPDC056064]|uniref:phytanoyl-CoA dioxygenase family protein n=1 Tax=Nocardia sp. NPDC056064 TaxID=3345701 RepID=UPI0035D713B2